MSGLTTERAAGWLVAAAPTALVLTAGYFVFVATFRVPLAFLVVVGGTILAAPLIWAATTASRRCECGEAAWDDVFDVTATILRERGGKYIAVTSGHYGLAAACTALVFALPLLAVTASQIVQYSQHDLTSFVGWFTAPGRLILVALLAYALVWTAFRGAFGGYYLLVEDGDSSVASAVWDAPRLLRYHPILVAKSWGMYAAFLTVGVACHAVVVPLLGGQLVGEHSLGLAIAASAVFFLVVLSAGSVRLYVTSGLATPEIGGEWRSDSQHAVRSLIVLGIVATVLFGGVTGVRLSDPYLYSEPEPSPPDPVEHPLEYVDHAHTQYTHSSRTAAVKTTSYRTQTEGIRFQSGAWANESAPLFAGKKSLPKKPSQSHNDERERNVALFKTDRDAGEALLLRDGGGDGSYAAYYIGGDELRSGEVTATVSDGRLVEIQRANWSGHGRYPSAGPVYGAQTVLDYPMTPSIGGRLFWSLQETTKMSVISQNESVIVATVPPEDVVVNVWVSHPGRMRGNERVEFVDQHPSPREALRQLDELNQSAASYIVADVRYVFDADTGRIKKAVVTTSTVSYAVPKYHVLEGDARENSFRGDSPPPSELSVIRERSKRVFTVSEYGSTTIDRPPSVGGPLDRPLLVIYDLLAY